MQRELAFLESAVRQNQSLSAESTGGAMQSRGGKINITEAGNLERWINGLCRLGLRYRNGRLLMGEVHGFGGRQRGCLRWQRRSSRPRRCWPSLFQLRDTFLQTIDAVQ